MLVPPTLLGLIAGLLVSHLLPLQYTSRSLISVPPPYGGPANMAVSELPTFEQPALSLDHLRPRIERGGITKPEEVEKAYEEIRKNTRLLPRESNDAAFFSRTVDLIYTDSTRQRAEQLCNILTSSIVEEGNTEHLDDSEVTIYFLKRQVADAKNYMEQIHGQRMKRSSDQELARLYRKARESYTALAAKLNQEEHTAELFVGGDPPSRGIVLPCSTPENPYFPERALCVALGSAIGLLLGIALMTANEKASR